MSDVAQELEFTGEQQLAAERMAETMGEFVLALRACHEAGLEPVQAFRACGIAIPALMAPLVNSQMLALIPDDEPTTQA